MNYTLGFIGCGNMGGALIRAAAKKINGEQIAVCDFDTQKTQALKEQVNVHIETAQTIAQNCRFVVMGVKPQVMESALSEIAAILQKRNDVTIITMAAGLSISAIRGYIGKDLPVIRIMPNTPVLVGAGMILFATADVDTSAESEFLNCFEKAGLLDKIPESEIDAGSALSGCGPAFMYAYARALAQGATECGVPQDKALTYAAQTMLGSAKMLLTYGDPDTLIKNVCSPGGTTIEGVKTLEKENLDGVAADAVKASYKRTLELKK